jgi:RimJ/RimL family protein N-acetyltransferase
MFPQGTIEIGWRLAPEYWGKGYATEAAEAWLAFGFETLGLDEIVSFAVAGNRRSTAVMERIGMKADPASDFDHPAIGDDYAHLRRHVTYRLSRADWQA